MAYRVPFLIDLHRVSAAMHRRPDQAGSRRRRVRAAVGRLPTPSAVARLSLARLEAEPGDPVSDYRNVLVAMWAASRMGLGADETVRYARAVLRADREEPGIGDVVRKIAGDLARVGKPLSERAVRHRVLGAQDMVLQRFLAAV